jgi:tRNA(fMet)-specific endonuclease VapC
MGLIFDTGIFIRAERQNLKDPLEFAPDGEVVGLATITVSELYEGVYLANSARRATERTAFIEQFALTLKVFPFSMEIAQVHAELRANQRRKGKTIGAHDLIIAATAMSLGWDVLTFNAEEFGQIEGLGVRTPY